MTVLEELGSLLLTRPGLGASGVEMAAWHERRAAMLEHAAVLGELPAESAAAWARCAHRKAAQVKEAVRIDGRC